MYLSYRYVQIICLRKCILLQLNNEIVPVVVIMQQLKLQANFLQILYKVFLNNQYHRTGSLIVNNDVIYYDFSYDFNFFNATF